MNILPILNTGTVNYNEFKNKLNNQPENQFEYKLNSINNLNVSYPKNYYIDSISFTGRISKASDVIKTIGEENFPSPKILEKLKELGGSRDYSLYDIHLDYYKDLLECTTLDEAKEKYPEFSDVIDARDIDISSLGGKNTFCKISQGKIEGADIETLSLDILKKYYGKLHSTKNKEEYWGMVGYTIYNNILNSLNIKILNNNYAITLKSHSPKTKEKMSNNRRELYADPNSTYNSEEYKQKRREANQRPEKREKQSDAMKVLRADPDSTYNSKEYKEKKKLDGKVHSEAYKRHPEITSKMKEIAKNFPRLWEIRSKKEKGIQLTKEEEIYVKAYWIACEKAMPGYKEIIGEERHKIRVEWGLEEE